MELLELAQAELKTEHDGVMQKIEAEQKKVEQLVDSELEQHHKLVQARERGTAFVNPNTGTVRV